MRPEAFVTLWNQTATVWATTIATGLGTALLMALFALFACLLLQNRMTPGWRCLLWWLVSAKLVVSVLWWLPVLPLTIPAPALPFFPASPLLPVAVRPALLPPSNALPPTDEQNTPLTPRPTQTALPSILAYVFALWILGIVLQMVLMARAVHRSRRALQASHDLSETPLGGEMRLLAVAMGVQTLPALVESPQVSTPLIMGWHRPTLILPQGLADTLTENERRMVLAHELAHLQRGDLLLSLAPRLARLFFFFLPAFPGFVCGEWTKASETACDALAVQATGALPGEYSRLLLKIIRQDSRPVPALLPTLAATSPFHTLHHRLLLLRVTTVRKDLALSLLHTLAVIGLIGVLPWEIRPALPHPSPPLSVARPFPLPTGAKDVADVPALDIQAEGDRDMRYLLIGGAAKEELAPPEGYRLLVVLPGGDGSVDFNPFIRRIRKRALGEKYLIAELVAKRWSKEQFNEVVWPTEGNPWPGMRFSTEQFIAAVVRDVSVRYKIDSRYIFVLGWASAGPAVYSASLTPETSLTGAFVAMSQFDATWFPSLSPARSRTYYILHPTDAAIVPPVVADRAVRALQSHGAKVKRADYSGGYGWHGDVYAQIRRGIRFLEEENTH